MKKISFTLTCCPFVTFEQLCEIGDQGVTWDFNRQIDSDYIRQHVSPDHRFPVTTYFEHRHRRMRPCELHMRLVIDMGDGLAIADVPMSYFQTLPEAYFVKREKTVVLKVLLDHAGHLLEVTKKGPLGRVEQAINFLARETRNKPIAKIVRRELAAMA